MVRYLFLSGLLLLSGCNTPEEEVDSKQAIVDNNTSSQAALLHEYQTQTAALKHENLHLKEELEKLQKTFRQVGHENRAFANLFSDIQTHSSARIKNTLSHYIFLEKEKFWLSPHKAYPMAQINMSGFREPMVILYGESSVLDSQNALVCAQKIKENLRQLSWKMNVCEDDRIQYMIRYPDSRHRLQFALPGLRGIRLDWGIYTLADRYDDGTMFLENTPGVWKNLWEWLEEKSLSPRMYTFLPKPYQETSSHTMALLKEDTVLRAEPDSHAKTIRTLHAGSQYHILGSVKRQSGNPQQPRLTWVKIRVFDTDMRAEEGWVHSRDVWLFEP